MDKFNLFTKLKWLNKYSISLILFFSWVAFFDKYSWLNQFGIERKIYQMNIQKKEYNEKLEAAKIEFEDILKDKEKYAREKYFMYKPGEEVFIIEQEKK